MQREENYTDYIKKPMSTSHTRISNLVTIVTIFENPKIAYTYALNPETHRV
jgi:hypothetical protein